MKIVYAFLISFLLLNQTNAQSLPTRAKERAKQRANNKADQVIDKGINKADQSIDSVFTKKEKDKSSKSEKKEQISGEKNAEKNDNGNSTGNTISSNGNVNTSKSFSDFIPGDNIIFQDNFAQDALGDFPVNWNTNGSGKIVTLNGSNDKWFEVAHNSIVNPLLKKALPENCTIEFDLFLQSNGQASIPNIEFGLTPVKDILKEDLYYKEKFYTAIRRYNENDGKTVEYGLQNPIGTKNDFPLLNFVNKVLHVSIAVNKTRVRVYLDETKLIDLPRALTDPMRNNFYLNNVYTVPASELGMLFSNFRIASADVDARSLLIKQLLEEGKTSTSDILFDVNSDVIKAGSFGIVNQFGDALLTNPSLKIKIIGHTDSDGAAAANLTLSQKRAAAVKKYLIANYGITGERILTDGKGATQSVAPNTTSEGKAKNRRVEFVKL